MDIGFALMPNGFMVGIEYYPVDDESLFSETNIYLLFFVIHIRVYI